MPHDRARARGAPLPLLLAILLAGLGGCSTLEALPVGPGSGTDELKRSRCACLPVDQEFGPGWREELDERFRPPARPA